LLVPSKGPTAEERLEVMQAALNGVAQRPDANDLSREMARFRRPHDDIFPADVFLDLAADALDVAGVTRAEPLEYAGIRERFLPECEFRGNTDHQKSHYALRAAAMIHGGVRPDLGEDAGWWRVGNLPLFALLAFVAYVRVAAERNGESVTAIARRIAQRHGVDVSV